jgi:hypothetical protein
MRIFISHDSVEVEGARALKASLARLGHSAFVSKDDLGPGRWEQQVDDALGEADVVIVLCTERALRSEWVWMEFGAARLRKRVIPVVVPGMGVDDLPDAIRSFQLVRLDAPEGFVELARLLDGDLPPDGGVSMFRELSAALDWRHIRPGRSLPPPGPQGSYLVDVSHGQAKWPRGGDGVSVFDGFGTAAQPVRGSSVPALITDHAVTVSDPLQLARGHLSDFPGLVVTSPWRCWISAETIDEIEAWVQRGGRLLLQGFEYGDRHHGANLNSLAARFGLHLRTDILAPADHAVAENGLMQKPYDVIVHLPVDDAAAHLVLEGVTAVEVVNAQSIDTEPGGAALLATGCCLIGEPVSQSGAAVDYVDGTFVGVGSQSRSRGAHPWLAMLAKAPPALCGDGEVLALGTWLLAGRSGPNDRFVTNLEAWLTGQR